MTSEIQVDPLSGRLFLLSPGRGDRPGIERAPFPRVIDTDIETCPFCEGRESSTPDELFALGRPSIGQENGPGWRVRVVPNLRRALLHQEVVVHTPQHLDSLADLRSDELAIVAEAWQWAAAKGRDDGRGYLHLFVNEGYEAGMTLSHSHSQLYWLPAIPPEVKKERQRFRGRCPVCDELAAAEADGRRILEQDGVVLFATRAARCAYELMIAPAEHSSDAFAASAPLPAAACALGNALARLYAARDNVRTPVNAWIHSLIDDPAYHWHVEVLPRISVPAGLELGAGIYLNSVRPEDAAETLRKSAPPDMPTGPPRAIVEAPKASLRRPLRVFYSYSHKDEAHRKRLETQLSLLRRQKVITDWHDRKIVAGEEWRRAIRDELEAADIILLLVSPDFLDSDFIWAEELQVAMNRHESGSARVIPIILKPVTWQETLRLPGIQALPRDAKPITTWPNRDLAWKDVADGIRAAAAELA